MAQARPASENKIDFRIYLGIVLFRWKIIAVCFLWTLLAGVIYVHLTPKKYVSTCNIVVYRDPLLTLSAQGSEWTSLQTHIFMLRQPQLQQRVMDLLAPQWAEQVGGRRRMALDVSARQARGINPMVHIRVEGTHRTYTRAYLEKLIREHEAEWQSVQRQARDSASDILQEELRNLAEKIRAAEDDVIEYQRLHDIARVEARGSMESRYLMGLMSRKNQLMTELMLLDAQFPKLEEATAAVIAGVGELTKQTGDVTPLGDNDTFERSVVRRLDRDEEPITTQQELTGFQDLRVRLERSLRERDELAEVLREDHPKMREVRNRIESLQRQLDTAAAIQLARLQDRQAALKIQLEALESAEYRWQAKNLMASLRQAEYARLNAIVSRFERNYNTLYDRLHNMRVAEELKAEHFSPDEIRTPQRPFWPDHQKILMSALALGLGAGIGLAFLLQTTDNKVQSIKDVEEELGLAFLGGIPYWAHSGLESAIRPIVTEDHSTGAIEAYRALRTSVLAELQKAHEKILIVTSADSREGKTLTALNMAIMVAQMGKKVLMVDMDLRRGRLHRSLGLDRDPGVTDVLRQKGLLADVIQPSKIANLDFAPSGSGIDDSAELLQSSDIVGMLVAVQDRYDYVIIDTSPVLRVTDTVILATQGMGHVLYIARVNHTPKPMIRYSLDMLKDANVLGLVMNSIEMHKISSLYYAYQYPNYAYYSNAYTYGYNYYYYDDKPRGHIRRSRLQRAYARASEWVRERLNPMG